LSGTTRNRTDAVAPLRATRVPVVAKSVENDFDKKIAAQPGKFKIPSKFVEIDFASQPDFEATPDSPRPCHTRI
jgi:hypothetical protein